MARSDTRYSVYPVPKAVEVVGDSAPALNQAIECWAELLARTMADNTRTFSESYSEWQIDLCTRNVCMIGPSWPAYSGQSGLMRTSPSRANCWRRRLRTHRLESIGDKWYFTEVDESGRKDRDAAVGRLAEELRQTATTLMPGPLSSRSNGSGSTTTRGLTSRKIRGGRWGSAASGPEAIGEQGWGNDNGAAKGRETQEKETFLQPVTSGWAGEPSAGRRILKQGREQGRCTMNDIGAKAGTLRHGLTYLWPSEIAEQYYCEYKVHLKRLHPEVRVDLPPLELGEVSPRPSSAKPSRSPPLKSSRPSERARSSPSVSGSWKAVSAAFTFVGGPTSLPLKARRRSCCSTSSSPAPRSLSAIRKYKRRFTPCSPRTWNSRQSTSVSGSCCSPGRFRKRVSGCRPDESRPAPAFQCGWHAAQDFRVLRASKGCVGG